MQNKSYSSPILERKTQSKSLHEQSQYKPLEFMQVQTKNPGIKIFQANYAPSVNQQNYQSKNTPQQQTYASNQPTNKNNNTYTMNKCQSLANHQHKVGNQPTYYHGGNQQQDERNKVIQSPVYQHQQQNQSKSIPPKQTIQHSPAKFDDLNTKVYIKNQPTYYQPQQQINIFPNRNQVPSFFNGDENIIDDDCSIGSKSTNLTVSQIKQEKIQSPFQSRVRQFESFNSYLQTIENKCMYCNQNITGTQILLQCNHFYCEKCFQAHVESLLMKLNYTYLKCLCGQKIKIQFLGRESKYYQDQVSKIQLNCIKSQYSQYIEECSNRCSFFWVKQKNSNYVRPYCPNCLVFVNRKIN